MRAPTIAVASGKGGTGKTTVSVNLARVSPPGALLLDCDVEEPNAHLFLAGRTVSSDTVTLPVPEVDRSLCNGCGECGRICQFHAIVPLGTHPLVFPEMCHSCGGCALVCPHGAIREVNRRIGVVETLRADHGTTLVQGRLDVGVVMAPPLIRAVKARVPDGHGAIIDAPPGTSCPVISAIRGADVVLLVTEPTPFGLHDLTLAVDTVRQLRMPFAVLVNRMGVGDGRVRRYCESEGIRIVGTIPDDRRIAEAYSRGEAIVDALPEYRGLFADLLAALNDLALTARREYAS